MSSLKTTFDRWIQLSHVPTYQNLCDLIFKNKVYQSCNACLVAFPQERDPLTLTELTTLWDQYYAVLQSLEFKGMFLSKLLACEARSEIYDDKVDVYAAQTFTHNKLLYQDQTWERQGKGHPKQHPPGQSSSEQRPIPTQPPIPPGKQFKDYSNPRGGYKLCGFWHHDFLGCPYKRHDSDGGSGQPKGNLRNTSSFSCSWSHRHGQCKRYHQSNSAEMYTEAEPNQGIKPTTTQEGKVSSTI